MSSPLISIVAPVFNNEKYLNSFIESVLSQTYTNWELILVDDGSTDKSRSICREYCQKDNRISVYYHSTNSGICKARNTGLLHSNGEWIFMTDSDDALLQNSLSHLVECISDDIDLISASYLRHVDGVLQKESKVSLSSKLSIRDYVDLIGMFPQSRNLERYVWNKMFRSSIIKGNSVLFNEGLKLFEDVCYVYQYLAYCTNSVYCTAVPVYSYYRKTGGTADSSRNHYTDRTLSWLLAYTHISAIIDGMDVSKDAKKRVKDELFDIYHRITCLIHKEKKGEKEEKQVNALLMAHLPYRTILLYNSRFYFRSALKKGKSCFKNLTRSVYR